MDQTRTGGKRPRKVLYGTNRSAASRAALLAVAGLAVGGATEVVVLHVADPGHAGEGRALVDDITLGLVALAVNARAEVREAPPDLIAETIAAVAAEQGAQLVVLGSRGRGDFGGLNPGCVAGGVLARISCPVLLARAGRRASARRQRVLVAVNGGEDTDELVGAAAAVADLDARVLVLHLPGPDGERSERIVRDVVAGLRRHGVRARGRLDPDPESPEESVRHALDFAADLVVMSRGVTGGPVPADARRSSRSNAEG